jgi:hypothetical protein
VTSNTALLADALRLQLRRVHRAAKRKRYAALRGVDFQNRRRNIVVAPI